MSIAPGPRKRRGKSRPIKPLTPEQKELAELYVPMAMALAWPLKRRWPQHADEFDSAAWLALVKAAGIFDPARHVKFSTFARRRIVGALKDVYRFHAVEKARIERGRLPSTGFHFDPRSEEKNPTPVRLGTRGRSCRDEPPIGHRMEHEEAFECRIAALPPRNADVCRLIYVEDMNQHDAAARLGISQSRFCYLHRESLAILNGTWSEWVAVKVRRRAATHHHDSETSNRDRDLA
jgi:RNA polymerase sigma factor (sigma-70 family)